MLSGIPTMFFRQRVFHGLSSSRLVSQDWAW
ncbi:hypothetical protein FOPG_16354 [Fusarium oxysporum f. sp. conglutinans race 2 54008]|uniref:Uncharacterized protein n=1 Tax=Fusarium oxysporum f. sp. conglutinans race 2 54008 TaxID=1089457 RepID=X0GV54_FUSOX|nr:hypothetical protein FOPG_16354 [Fusarium oxysporum f. sp. conglutinans race 2 54008]